MLNKLSCQLLSIFTLLTLVVQSLVWTDHVMAQTVDNSTTMMVNGTAHCADEQSILLMAKDCCSSDIISKTCCDGKNTCTGDCSHCLSISVTGVLLSHQYWLESLPYRNTINAVIPRLNSILLTSKLRPPIV